MRRSSSLRRSGLPTAASAISNGVFGASFKPVLSNFSGRIFCGEPATTSPENAPNLLGRLALDVRFCKSAQRSAIDLVGRGERQLVDEPDEARMLIGRPVGEREALD